MGLTCALPTMSSQTTDDSLNDRAQQLLKLLVEHYIRDGQPVGSRTLSRDIGMGLVEMLLELGCDGHMALLSLRN